MDHFGREELLELLEEPRPPAISIYLPTHRAGNEAEADRLRFRAALDRARELLVAEYEEEIYEPLLEDLVPLTRDAEFWRYQSDGLAAFRADGLGRLYRVPARMPEIVVVGSSFHTRPLVDYLQAPDRYWILGLGQKKVRLWEGTADGLTPVDLAGLPASFREALNLEFTRDTEIVHRGRSGDHRGGPGMGGRPPTFHGHGLPTHDMTEEMKQFFRRVDGALQEFLEGETGPLVLAAVRETHPIYRSVSRLGNLAEEGVEASVMDWDEKRLHEAAWPIARRSALRKIEEAVELWESAYGAGKGEPDLANLARLSISGRIRLLLTERDRRIWGRVNRGTGALEVLREGGEDPGNHAVELLDELAEMVILRGGQAMVLPGDRMPTRTGAAGILR